MMKAIKNSEFDKYVTLEYRKTSGSQLLVTLFKDEILIRYSSLAIFYVI